MKTFGKKLISLMLVALMLVAAVPFGVFADEVDENENEVDGGAAYQDLAKDVSADLVVKDNNDKVLYTKTKGVTITNQYNDLTADQQESKTKKIYDGLSFANKGAYERTGAGTFNGLIFTIEVSVKDSHNHSTSVVKYVKDSSEANQPDADYHYYVCSICGDSAKEGHAWKLSKGDADGHVKTCTVCGYQEVEDHGQSGEKVTVTAEKPATCTATGTTEKKVYACGYVEGGEKIDKIAHNFVDGKCTECGTYDSDSTSGYNVTIQYKSKDIVTGATLKLTPAELNELQNASASNKAKTILGKAEGASSDDDKIISAYYGSSAIFSAVTFNGNDIVIAVTKDLSSSVTTDVVNVDVIDGNETEARELVVGKRYFSYNLALTNSNNKTLASVRVTNSNGVVRTIRSTDTGSDSKVQPGDTVVELLWDATKVTIEFYRHGGNGAEKVTTMTIRAGEAISGLPLLDNKYVTWYLESGELLQEGRSYDFKSTTVRAYPSTNGDVYLMIYKNGDTKTPVRSNPENITAYVQDNGLVSVKDLKKVVEDVVGKKGTAYLFDFDGWENYKATKSTKDSADTFDVGTADSRTGVQFLYVMVTGASGSSSNADSSNPKTGDTAMIGTAFAVMAVAAIGLGTATVVLKKKEEF